MEHKLGLALLPFLALSAFSLFFNAHAMDEYTYLLMARSFASGDLMHNVEPSRFPAFPLALGIVFRLFGESLLAARLFNIFLGVLTVALAYYAGKKFFGEEAGFWAAAFLGSSPFFAFLSSAVLSESMFFLLLLASVLLVYKAGEDKRWLIALGGVASLLTLTRFFGLYLGFVAIAYWLRTDKLKTIVLSREFVLGCAALLAVAAPWLWYSYALTGDGLGLMKQFFSSNVQFVKGGFALPDLVPSYLLLAPFIAGAAIVPIVLRHREIRKFWENEKQFLFFAAFALSAISLELYGFLHFRLLRYLVPAAPFLSILAGICACSSSGVVVPWLRRFWKPILIACVLANFAAGAFVIRSFGTSQKQVGYYEASQFVAANCASYYSNFERVIQFFSHKPQVDASQAQCYAVSTIDPPPVQAMPSGMRLVYDSHGMKVFER